MANAKPDSNPTLTQRMFADAIYYRNDDLDQLAQTIDRNAESAAGIAEELRAYVAHAQATCSSIGQYLFGAIDDANSILAFYELRRTEHEAKART